MRHTLNLLTLLVFVLEMLGAVIMAAKLWGIRKASRFAAWWGRAFTIYFIGEVIVLVGGILQEDTPDTPIGALVVGLVGRIFICTSIWICIGYLSGRLNGIKIK